MLIGATAPEGGGTTSPVGDSSVTDVLACGFWATVMSRPLCTRTPLGRSDLWLVQGVKSVF